MKYQFKNLKKTYYQKNIFYENLDVYSKLNNDIIYPKKSNKLKTKRLSHSEITYQNFFSFIFGMINEKNIDIIINFLKN